MIKKDRALLGLNKSKKSNTDFSDFIHNAPDNQKKKILTEVLRDANNDQRKLIERHRQTFQKTTL